MTTTEFSALSRCTNCDHQLRRFAKYCSHCGCALIGTELPQPAAILIGPESSYSVHWTEIKRVGWLFGLLLLLSLMLGMVTKRVHTEWPMIIASVVSAVIVIAFAIHMRSTIAPLLARPNLNRGTWFSMLYATMFSFGLIILYFSLVQQVGFPFMHMTSVFQKSGWPLGWILFFVSVMPGVMEELAFRGVIQSSLQNVVGEKEAWIIQAALFSALHLMPLIFFSHFLMGLCFGYVRSKSKSLYPGMVLHATWNALVVCNEFNLFQ